MSIRHISDPIHRVMNKMEKDRKIEPDLIREIYSEPDLPPVKDEVEAIHPSKKELK